MIVGLIWKKILESVSGSLNTILKSAACLHRSIPFRIYSLIRRTNVVMNSFTRNVKKHDIHKFPVRQKKEKSKPGEITSICENECSTSPSVFHGYKSFPL